MATQSKDALQALMTKLSGIITGEKYDGDKPQNRIGGENANYLAWCSPGLPFKASDMKFLTRKAGTEDPNLDRADFEFSYLVNTIPAKNVLQRFQPGSGTVLWDVFKNTIADAQIYDIPLTADEEKDIAAARKVFEKEVEEDGEKIIQKTLKVKAYDKMRDAFDAELMRYNGKMIAASNYNPEDPKTTKDDKEAYQDFQRNGALYMRKLTDKYAEWEAEGYKGLVEGARNTVAKLQQKSPLEVRQSLEAKFKNAVGSKNLGGVQYYPTSLVPSNFLSNDEGWTQFTFSNSEVRKYSSVKKVSTDPSLNIGWGFWKLNAGTVVDSNTEIDNVNTEDLKISFSIAQTPIIRGWFNPDFLLGTGWRLKPNSLYGNGLADGKGGGVMGSYPSGAIWIKDLKIESKVLADHVKNDFLKSDTNTKIGWGPFSIGAKTTTDSTSKSKIVTVDGNTIEVKGTQIIAFLCYVMPKLPNPADLKGGKWI